MFITRVLIANFRSIRRIEFEPNALSVIVGGNDVGKSNVLRALNLFFNGETEPGRPFSFRDDYSGYATVAKRKAKEVIVEVELSPPSNYTGPRSIRWRKRWRSQGFHDDSMTAADGSPLPSKSKGQVWARNLRYRYVPAVKGTDFFSRLLMDLHDVLSETVEDELRSASLGFTSKVKGHLGQIVEDLRNNLKLDSDIGLPADLRDVFASLEFRSTQSGVQIPLSRRGDGVKARHIPIILSSIAIQENKLATPGRVRINTIWGYEEPENNLESSAVMSLRDELVTHSEKLQILLTTHSPALYNLGETDKGRVTVFVASKDDDSDTVLAPRDTKDAALDYNPTFGILHMVAPHVEAAEKAREEAALRLDLASRELRRHKAHTVWVEGPTDARVLKAAIALFGDSNKMAGIEVRPPAGECAGASGVADMLIAWAHGGRVEKAYGIFDFDKAGQDALKKVGDRVSNATNIKHQKLVVPPHLYDVRKKKYLVPVSLEELFPPFVWTHAENQEWLEERPDLTRLYGHEDPHTSFFEALSGSGLSSEQQRYVTHRVGKRHKDTFAKKVSALPVSDRAEAFAAFESIVRSLEEFFDSEPEE